MGLDINYFYSLTPRQFGNIQRGWADRRDAESKERLILTRRLMYSNLVPWSKNLNEQKLWPFDWETETQDLSTPSEDELEASKKRWEMRDALRNNQKN